MVSMARATTPIIDLFVEVAVRVDDSDYQGDTRVLLKKDEKWGFLVIGWGSCSGCDALQGCGSYKEIGELIGQLDNDIQWFESLTSAKEYILSIDRKGSFYSHQEEWELFRKQVAEVKDGSVNDE